MNKHLDYLTELEKDLARVVGFLHGYKSEVTDLKNLNYTPNTIVLLKNMKHRLESTDFTKLIETVERGVNSL